jgi:hypothetical protein
MLKIVYHIAFQVKSLDFENEKENEEKSKRKLRSRPVSRSDFVPPTGTKSNPGLNYFKRLWNVDMNEVRKSLLMSD